MKKNKKFGKSTANIIFTHICTPFNAFNFAIGVCIALTGEYKNLLYLAVILCNILIGVIQDLRSKRTVEKLSILARTNVALLRDDRIVNVSEDEICTGDTICLKRGNQICADCVVKSDSIEVNEAMLTGESEPVLKGVGDKLFSGSFVTGGSCTASVVAISSESYAQKITSAARSFKSYGSAILAALNKLVRFTSFFIIPLGVVLFYESYVMQNNGLNQSIISTSGSLLGLLPKGLVLLTSASLMLGIIKLGKRRVLVQELYGIESLARVDILCMDKTGTLTDGKMCVDSLIPAREKLDENALRLIRSFVCTFDDGNSSIEALKDYLGSDSDKLKPISVIPFSSERRWSAAQFETSAVILGAPEVMFPLEKPAEISSLQSNGKRILVFAFSQNQLSDGLPNDILPVAYASLQDHIKSDAAKTLKYFDTQGVEIRIFSGDDPNTAGAIASEAGIKYANMVVDASTLKTDKALVDAAEKYTVFGRVSPEQKEKLVIALQEKGHTVGMLGDGVNDVLAIKRADCGIAMASGCDAARRVARLVLLDNSFSVLPAIVGEGRRVIGNIKLVAPFFLTKTVFTFILSMFCAVTATTYPLLPFHLSIYGMLCEAIPAFLLTFMPNSQRLSGDILKDAIKKAALYGGIIAVGIAVMSLASSKLVHSDAFGAWSGFAWAVTIGAILVVETFVKSKRMLSALSKGNMLLGKQKT